MALVIAHAELVSDQTSDPRTAPQRRREAVRLGAFQQQRLEAFELRGVQQRLTAGAAGLAQPGFAVTPVSSQPLADALPRDLQSPRCLGLTTALLDQPDRFETALLQGLEIPPYAFCISHTYKDVRTPKRCHFILRDSIIPPDLRLDNQWLQSLNPRMATDAVIEFQPLLGRIEVEVLIRSISKLLDSDRKEALTGVGIDFSGRQWTRGMLTRETLQDIAQLYFSVQTLHSPLTSLVVARRAKGQPEAAEPARIERAVQDITNLPAVALLDTGVPQQHSVLSVYRRGSYVAPDSYGQPVGYHGSFVASRIVFGDLDFGDTAPSTPREAHCRFYDALVASSQSEIDDKSVVPAIQGVVATAPDVRVFNLSFDTQPLLQLDSTKRRENLFLVQDLDNLVFRDDLLVVVAAGNSKPGVIPATPYPNHYDDESWQLGAWARSFNSLTCGSHVARLRSGGIVSRLLSLA